MTGTEHSGGCLEVLAHEECYRLLATQGWSVLVRGLAEEVGDRHSADIVRRATASGVQPWAPGSDWHWMRIIPHAVAGRRIRRPADGDGEPEYGWFG